MSTETIVLVDDNDVPLTFPSPSAEQLAQTGRAADLYYAQQLGEEAARGDAWCAAVGIASFKDDPEAQEAYAFGFNSTLYLINRNNK